MRAFQDFALGWRGQSYVIPSRALLPVIAAVEDHITLADLLDVSLRGRVSAARVSQAYAAVLRAAGVKGADGKAPIAAEEVYAGIFDGGNVFAAINEALVGLCGLMIPPELPAVEAAALPGKPGAAPAA